MDVSIIIVNYNTKELITNCIQSIYDKTTGIDYEIIVVDNASFDGSQQMIAEKFPDIKLIELNENIGFGSANNKAIEFATGRNLLFLNPDTKLINNAIKILSDYLGNSPKSGACGGNLLDDNLNPTQSFRLNYPSLFFEINEMLMKIPEKLLFGKNREYNYSNKYKCVAYITGADLMIKKTVIDEVGNFNPVFFMYFEETDLCNRINKKGYNIISIPEAKIQHLEGKSFGEHKVNASRINRYENSRKKYYSLHYSITYSKVANMIYLTNILTRISLQRLLKHNGVKFWEMTLKEFRLLNIDKI
jgi:GT2 family glycosyltransferase